MGERNPMEVKVKPILRERERDGIGQLAPGRGLWCEQGRPCGGSQRSNTISRQVTVRCSSGVLNVGTNGMPVAAVRKNYKVGAVSR